MSIGSSTAMSRTGNPTEEMTEVRQIRLDEWPLLKRVRLAALSDSPKAFSETIDEVMQHPDTTWQERASGGSSFCAIAINGAEPVGMAVGILDSKDPTMAYLVAMWVAPPQRGTTTARALVECVESWAVEFRCRVMIAGVKSCNARALAFYRKCGFATHMGEQHQHHAVHGCDTVLSKKLTKRTEL